MATITKRGDYQFQATIRRKGFPTQSKTFETKRDAEKWATVIESEMHRRVFTDRSEAERTTLSEALERYGREITPTKLGQIQEARRIKQLLKHPLAARSLASLRSVDFSAYRNMRAAQVSAHTVRLELALLSNLFTILKEEWSIPIENPIASISKPKTPKSRERRLICTDNVNEEEKLLATAAKSRAHVLKECIQLAIETGMRAGEIVQLTWDQIDLKNSVIRLDITKNGDGRIVPLSVAAEAVLRSLPRAIDGGRVTQFYDSAGLSRAFNRACESAGIEGLRFHDLRHEAASRLAPHMPAQTLAKVMGWKCLQMAMKYYNPNPPELVAAVRGIAKAA
jgi:integrase